jgi:hypothetical protein
MNTANKYKLLTFIAAFLFFLVLLFLSQVSFAGDTRKKPRKHRNLWYWRETTTRGIERYQHNRPGWPYEHGCSGYYTSQPIKSSTLRALQRVRRARA